MKTTTTRILLPLVLWLAGLSAHATTYYVSGSGNDSNNGTSQATAWRTIARVQQQMSSLQAGDQVLFQRGGTYPGELSIYCNGTAAAPVVFGAYGTGERPIISGGVPVTGWVQHQGHIWRAPVTTAVKYLVVNNEPMTLARYPNTGWLRNVNGSTTQINTGGVLGQGNGYWNGATVVARTTNWCYETATVSGFNGGVLTFNAITSNLSNNDWGFFLCNKLSELDMAGEWFYDAAAGQVYLWAPGNADPNGLAVLGSVYSKGMAPGWQKQYLTIQDLCFQGQKDACISTEGSFHVTVSNCTFRHAYKAISSSGGNNTYTGNTISDIFATAINIYDDNTTISSNTLTDCAVRPGMGESVWGHMGINSTGLNNVIRGNRLDNIGYIGIVAGKNALIERNVVHNATSILNDGGGIAFDNADGMIIQDNIVTDLEGSLESTATNFVSYYKICMGIYFGNTSIKNTIVRRNTVARCKGAGIHVDHTQVSVNNQIKDNVLFDNEIQLSLSDMSNNTGPGATPPFYVPNFNDVYSGNVMYSIRPEQLCMRHFNVHGPGLVDFGTFTNNRYFSPYEELSIYIHNTNSAEKTWYTLEHWQQARGEDAGSTRSTQRLSKYAVDQVLNTNMIPNGSFDQNVGGWGGWPTEGQVTRDATYLDNGALKVNFTNNATYNTFFLYPDQMPTIQNNAWYRLRFSVQSNMRGTVQADIKGQSQLTGPYSMFNRPVPFDSERRDMTVIFQSDRSEPVRCQFINDYDEGRYWLDNVVMEQVQVSPIDPYARHTLLVNDEATAQTFTLTGCWRDVNGNLHTGEVELGAYSSLALQKEADDVCSLITSDDELLTAQATIDVYPNPVIAGEKLYFSTPIALTTEARLIDAMGRTIQTDRLVPGARAMTVGARVKPGAYSLVLSNAAGHRHLRVVVQH
ncbi:MAG: right-handed parallel beta-helix repeat-containing protein [Flavobacteriales bacterium]